jgi:hypothetical protein
MNLKQKSLGRYYRIAAVFSLFQKSLTPDKTTDTDVKPEEEGLDYSRIRCPLCKWQPQASSRWYCVDCGYPEYFFDSCGTAWNTFDTRGICPGCAHQWRWTACLYCAGWSLHEEWYTEEPE